MAALAHTETIMTEFEVRIWTGLIEKDMNLILNFFF